MANSYDQVYHTVSVNLILVSQCRHRATRSITVWQSIALNPHIFPSEWFAFYSLVPLSGITRREKKVQSILQDQFFKLSTRTLLVLLTWYTCLSREEQV